jgi:pyruvate carboxylase subunit B
MITGQVKDLCYGLYGKTAVPIDEEVQKKALKGYARGESRSPAVRPRCWSRSWKRPRRRSAGWRWTWTTWCFTHIYPVTGKKFLKWKYGKEEPPAEVKPRTLEQHFKAKDAAQESQGRLLVEKMPRRNPGKGRSHAHLQRFRG